MTGIDAGSIAEFIGGMAARLLRDASQARAAAARQRAGLYGEGADRATLHPPPDGRLHILSAVSAIPSGRDPPLINRGTLTVCKPYFGTILHMLNQSTAVNVLSFRRITPAPELPDASDPVRTSRPPRSTCMPIWRSKSAPWPERDARPIPPHRQTSRLPGGALIMPLPSQRSPPPRPVWPRWSA